MKFTLNTLAAVLAVIMFVLFLVSGGVLVLIGAVGWAALLGQRTVGQKQLTR
jgi:hypothetical protein